MKDLKDFMKWNYTEDLDIILDISGKNLVKNQPVTAEDFKLIISEWWIKCRHLDCVIDLCDVNLLHLDIVGFIKLIKELEDYNKGTTMLRSIKFLNASKIHKWVYFCIRFGISRELRDIIRF